MRNILFFLICLLVPPLNAKPQSADNRAMKFVEIYSNYFEGSQVAYHISPERRYNDIQGSPYLFEEWADGSILMKTDSLPADFRMRYNIYGNEMQFVYKADTFAIFSPLKVAAVWLDKRRFEYLPFFLNENEHYGYFEVLSDGKYRLLRRYGVRLDAGRDPVTPYHCQNSVDRFVRTENWYYQAENTTEVIPLPGSAATLSREKAWNAAKVKEYCKSARIRLHREEDLIRLFTWLNQPN